MSTTLESPALVEGLDGAEAAHGGMRTLTVALAGNPNAGKTSLFNALTGLRQKVANYPGVTVERKEGDWQLAPDSPPARLIDLPGLYSLDAASIDERIARDVLTGRVTDMPAPDVVVAAVDATNLERNLYLVTQLLEVNRPLVIALTMIDIAEREQIEIDALRLSEALGVAVVPVTARQGRGLDELARAVIEAAAATAAGAKWRLSPQAEEEIRRLSADGEGFGREAALRDLYSDELPEDAERREAVAHARSRLAQSNAQWWQEPLTARYEWIGSAAAGAVRGRRAARERTTATDRIDALVTHKIFGPVVLLLVMLVVFQTIFSWATLPMDLISQGFGTLGEAVRGWMPPGLLTDLLVDGAIAGVGGVLVFLPQILLLFFFIALLEDSGYMSRAAFLMDRLMRGVGLHGKAFMPLLSSFACAIPGIMATRTIENPKDRLATIMIAPFMSCSARLPVYTLMIAAFFTDRKLFGFVSVGALIILSMYLLGIAVAVCVAWVLKRTILKAPPPPLVLELPPYRMPGLLNIVQTMRSRAWIFVKRAGTVIMAISILLWALMTSRAPTAPRARRGERAWRPAMREKARSPRRAARKRSRDERPTPGGSTSRRALRRVRGASGPPRSTAIEPLGFDWKMALSIASFAALRRWSRSSLSSTTSARRDRRVAFVIEACATRSGPTEAPWTPLATVSMMVFLCWRAKHSTTP